MQAPRDLCTSEPADNLQKGIGNEDRKDENVRDYHDHVLGITHLNAYAGVASAYIIRDKFEENVLVKQLGLPEFVENGGRELPLVFQDKLFQDPNNLDLEFLVIGTEGSFLARPVVVPSAPINLVGSDEVDPATGRG